MTPIFIKAWSVEVDPRRPFAGPEISSRHLVGTVEGRTGEIITSQIVKAEGRLVTTKSGSVYQLGDPSPEYLAWMAERGLAYDEAQPIKMAGGA